MIVLPAWFVWSLLTVIAVQSALLLFLSVRMLRREPPRLDVTPSCGCIMCDLKVPRQRNPLGYFHQTQHGTVACDLF